MNIYEVMLLTLFAALITSFAQLMFKRHTKRIESAHHVLALLYNKGVMVGLGGYVIGLLFYLAALSGGELSLVYPLFASSFIFVTILSSVLLKEKITLVRAAGILIIFAGIILVAIS